MNHGLKVSGKSLEIALPDGIDIEKVVVNGKVFGEEQDVTDRNVGDMISRQAAIDALRQLQKNISGDYTELDPMVMAGCGYIGDCIGELECLPSAQPERKKGKWIYYDPNGFKCSRCGRCLEIGCGDVKMNFCPNCGADMRGDSDK